MFKHWEFWNPRVFEFPYYVYLLWCCLRGRLPPKYLAKADFALDHGEIGIGSKYVTQMAFDQTRFPASAFVPLSMQNSEKRQLIASFAAEHGYPLILKPDMGAVGKGLMKIADESAISTAIDALLCDYILQAYCDLECEYGVFFVRIGGVGRITAINQKHFPTVTGNGRDSIASLAAEHDRYTGHWALFLQYVDVDRVPDDGERVRLSFVGSHTMGCKFTDDTEINTSALEAAICKVCDSQPGFNFGRLDVRAESEQALVEGEFVMIEANGVASLPTNMYDPAHSLWRAYAIFFSHARLLVQAANEHRLEPMELRSWADIWARVKASQASLNKMHAKLINSPGDH